MSKLMNNTCAYILWFLRFYIYCLYNIKY